MECRIIINKKGTIININKKGTMVSTEKAELDGKYDSINDHYKVFNLFIEEELEHTTQVVNNVEGAVQDHREFELFVADIVEFEKALMEGGYI